MTIVLELSETMEHQLREEAARNGLTLDRHILQRLKEESKQPESSLNQEEKLLSKIDQWIPEHQLKTYRALVKKRMAENISESEYQELLRLTDVVETAHAVRMKHLMDLSILRGISLDQIMKDLGLRHQRYA